MGADDVILPGGDGPIDPMVPTICVTCDGDGLLDDGEYEPRRCPDCDGEGVILSPHPTLEFPLPTCAWEPCDREAMAGSRLCKAHAAQVHHEESEMDIARGRYL